MTQVNDSPLEEDSTTPFGGEKASGHRTLRWRLGSHECTTDSLIRLHRECPAYPI